MVLLCHRTGRPQYAQIVGYPGFPIGTGMPLAMLSMLMLPDFPLVTTKWHPLGILQHVSGAFLTIYLLESKRSMEYGAAHLGHRNRRNIRVYAPITNPWCEQGC
jgi:hypothetical protein